MGTTETFACIAVREVARAQSLAYALAGDVFYTQEDCPNKCGLVRFHQSGMTHRYCVHLDTRL